MWSVVISPVNLSFVILADYYLISFLICGQFASFLVLFQALFNGNIFWYLLLFIFCSFLLGYHFQFNLTCVNLQKLNESKLKHTNFFHPFSSTLTEQLILIACLKQLFSQIKYSDYFLPNFGFRSEFLFRFQKNFSSVEFREDGSLWSRSFHLSLSTLPLIRVAICNG